MKLLNKAIVYISVSLLFIVSLWAFVFYFNMLDEIKESVDEGLDNYKRQIIYRAQTDSMILEKSSFEEGFFAISGISRAQALSAKDRYIDTLMYMQDADDEQLELEPVRMLMTAFENEGRFYELRIINSMVEEDDLMEELLWEALWLYSVLVLVIVVINNVVLRRLWKPFYAFLHQLKNYRLGSSGSFPGVRTRTKEFADLQNAVNILLQHNLETYEQQKQFIGNAAHELQTPLAIATNKLELLMEKEGLESEQAEGIAEIMDIVERMVRLNKSLLLLTRIENKQFLDNQPVSLNNIVYQTVRDLEEMAEFKDVRISVTEHTELFARMDISLANTVVSNLLRNAVFHNVPNGTVHVEIFENKIRFLNTGKKESLNAREIFSRFYKSGNERSGTGLGLAIVKAICTLYDFSVSYDFVKDQHCFEWRLSNH